MRGRFITLEGIEGAGKTTALAHARELLEEVGLTVHVTREPGGTELAERIRELLLEEREEDMTSAAELLLVFAARSQHLAHVIEPRLAAGDWVLCDRFTDATFAYQGSGRKVPARVIRWLEDYVQGGLRPDATLLLDVDPQIGLHRARGDSSGDRFEQEDIEFFARVREGYLEAARREPARFHVIDAGDEQAQVLDQIRWMLTHFLDSLV